MNRLADETSPYLLQHADNPVDWYPWGEEALGRARDEDKPILLSIGYAACHWCHVMEHESFEDASTAALMNEHFVNVKVDREERPDLDAVYMEAVVALSGHGGWPMTVFLTPAGEPFYGGTYYPPEPRHGLPSFRQLLDSIAEAWRDRRGDVSRAAAQLVEAVRRSAELRPSNDPLTELGPVRGGAEPRRDVRAGARRLGTGAEVPERARARVPAPARRAARWSRRRSTRWRPAACTTCSAAASTATRSTTAGSCRTSRRCSTTTPCSRRRTCTAGSSPARSATARSPTRRSSTCCASCSCPEGGFASAQDADTDGVEGLTFTWTEEEGAPAELLEPFEHGRSIIRGELDEETRARLLAIREQRPKPLRDDKAIASWNGLALAALAEAGWRLDRPDWVDAARRLGEFLLGPLSDADGRLRRSRRDGRTSGAGYLDDYANVAHGLLELHVATGELRWLREARRLALLAVELFADEEHGGFFLAPADGEELVARTKELDDHPLPSGNSMLAHVLLRLARIYGDDELERRGVSVLRLLRPALERAPSAFGWGLVALDLHLSPPRELAIAGPVDSESPARRSSRGSRARSWRSAPAEDVPLLAGKGLVDGRPAVYVCERFACRAPVTELAHLDQIRAGF